MRPNLFPVALFILVGAGCSFRFGGSSDPRVWIEDRQASVIEAGVIDRVDATTRNGSITVAVGDVDRIELVAVKRAGGEDREDAERAMRALRVTHERAGTRLILGVDWDESPRSRWGERVAFELVVPPHVAVHAQTHNGRIESRGTAARLHAETHNGSIDVETGDSFDLKTHNGRILARVTAAGPIEGRVTAHNGVVQVTLEDRVSAKIVCASHRGRIRLPQSVANVQRDAGSLVGVVGDGSGRLEVETHNGGLTVR